MVPLRAGGGLEHNGIGKNGRGHHTGHALGGHEPPVLIHTGNDGIGGAHRLVADVDGVGGLNVRQPVVVDDLQDLRLLQAGHGLGGFVVVHQHHPLPAGPQQMIPAEKAYDLLVPIQNGIAGFPVLQHGFLHIVHPVLQVEADQIVLPADPADGGGLEDHPGSPVGGVGGGDDAGGGGKGAQLLVQLRLAQDQGGDVHLQGPADHIRLMAAEDDGVLPAPQQALPALGQGNGDLAGDGIHLIPGIVEDLALQHGEHVEEGHIRQLGPGDQVHVVGGDIVLGEHTVKGAVLVGHRQGGNIGLGLENLPGLGHGNVGIQHRRGIVVQVLDLGVHAGDTLGGLEAEPVQHQLGLVRHPAQAGGLILPVSQGAAQCCVGHSRHDRICIRVAVPGNINRVHDCLLSVDSC